MWLTVVSLESGQHVRAVEQPELPKSMIQNRLDVVDLFIINKLNDRTYGWRERKDLSSEEEELLEILKRKPWLNEGSSITTLDKVVEKELGIHMTRAEVERRIEKLAQDKILLSLHSVVIDPTKFFDHVAHIYLKIPISERGGGGWWEALDKIWTIDKNPKHGETPTNIVRIAGVIEGTGDYDVILFVYTNDMENVSRFLYRLTQEGLVEKSMTQRIWTPTGIKFDPTAVPGYGLYVATLSTCSEILDKIRKPK